MSFLDNKWVKKLVTGFGTSGGGSQLYNFANGKGDKGKHTTRNFLDPGGYFTKEHYAKEDAKRAEQAAAQTEAERQAAVKKGIGDVNSVFDAPGRQAQYDQFANALRTSYMQDAQRQKAVADRGLKFSLAGAGLTGGSADRDARRTSGEEFTRGVLRAENQTQDAVADLKGQDEQSRMNLIQLVTNGLDATTAMARGNAAMATNAAGRQARAASQGLGDVFTNTAAAYKRQQDAAAFRRGTQTPVGSLYGLPGGR